jgi:hypothetical protein
VMLAPNDLTQAAVTGDQEPGPPGLDDRKLTVAAGSVDPGGAR